MFKITLLVLILLSSFLLFNKRSFLNYNTYLLLNDILKLLNRMNYNVPMGNTYIQSIKQINTYFFKDCSFNDISHRINGIYCDENIKTEIISFLSNLGKSDIKTETEYISRSIEYYRYKAREFKGRYDNNYKADIIAGLSVGIVICIVII